MEYPSCISFDSYIKPQPMLRLVHRATSCISFDSYIKPQRECDAYYHGKGCISFDSYIKPQQPFQMVCYETVVYLLTPTSNHNLLCRNRL